MFISPNKQKIIQNFIFDKSGNIAILFAVLFPLLILVMGGVIDYAIASQKKGQVQHAADMAVLAALKTYNNRDIPQNEKVERAEAVGEEFLESNLKPKGIELKKFQFNLLKNDEGHNIATFNWKASSETTFLKIAGIDDIELSDQIEASMTPSTSKYVDLYIMVDLSSSMGVPATKQGIARLKNEQGCEFSCHDSYSYNRYARQNGIKLRMDVVRSAIADIADKISNLESNRDDQYRIGLYGFTTTGKTILEPTEDMDQVRQVANSIGVENAHTVLKAGIDHLKSISGTQGEGSSDEDRIKLAVYLSDGLHDEATSWPYYTKSIGDVDCRLGGEGKEIKLITVYTTYEPFNSVHYRSMVQPHAARLGPDLEKCASDGAYFQTSNANEIQAAFDEIFVEFTVAGDLKLTK